ncbi:MAG: D-alanyl-D-alanine carboxypeptidase family protein [Microthrixaceae bacterium]
MFSFRNGSARGATTFLLVAATLVALPAPQSGAAPSQEGSSLSELQAKRSQVRSEKASQASKVNALEATDAEVTNALNALNAQVKAQQDKVEESERVLAKAEEDRAAAEQAQAEAEAQLASIREDMKESAVEAYVSVGSTDPLAAVATDDVNDAVNKRVLLDSRATQSTDLVERFRAVQEDLEMQRAAKQEAEDRATAERETVTARKAELDASYAEQQKFAEAVDARLDAALAEAASLAQLDKGLSDQITAKQQEIARQLAAQRKAEEQRAAARAAANKAALAPSSGGSSGGGSGNGGDGGGNYTPPNIVGSGSIVSVGGIRVHQSIAGNLQALLSAAAADGVPLSGSGFRDPAGQIAVRRSNCGSSNYAIYQMSASSCRPPTARPGTSQHEQGLAVDFTQGGRTLTRGSSGFAWMRANAGRFGFRNLPSEPWHWSTTGR